MRDVLRDKLIKSGRTVFRKLVELKRQCFETSSAGSNQRNTVLENYNPTDILAGYEQTNLDSF